MTIEQSHELFRAVGALTPHAPLREVIQAYDALQPAMLLREDQLRCERIATAYREALQVMEETATEAAR